MSNERLWRLPTFAIRCNRKNLVTYLELIGVDLITQSIQFTAKLQYGREVCRLAILLERGHFDTIL